MSRTAWRQQLVPQVGESIVPYNLHTLVSSLCMMLSRLVVAVTARSHLCADTQTCLHILLAATQHVLIPAAPLAQQHPHF